VTSSHKIVIINEASLGELNPIEIKNINRFGKKAIYKFYKTDNPGIFLESHDSINLIGELAHYQVQKTC